MFIGFFLKIFIRQVGTLIISCYILADVSDTASSQLGTFIFLKTGAKTNGRALPWLPGIPHNSN